MSQFPKKDWSAQKRRACSATEIVTHLAHLEGWKLTGDGAAVAVEKSFHFANYFETIAFVNGVALIAHKEDHHPNLLVRHSRCTVSLSTHDVSGISTTDFDCAGQIDALLA